MRYSVEPRDRINLKGYGFLSFAKKMNNKIVKRYLILLKTLQQMQ